jgi:hypothetical protein
MNDEAERISEEAVRYYPWIRLKGLRETTKSPSKNNRCPDQDSNLAALLYKSTALPDLFT